MSMRPFDPWLGAAPASKHAQGRSLGANSRGLHGEQIEQTRLVSGWRS